MLKKWVFSRRRKVVMESTVRNDACDSVITANKVEVDFCNSCLQTSLHETNNLHNSTHWMECLQVSAFFFYDSELRK